MKWKHEVRRAVALIFILCMTLPVMVVESSECTAIEEREAKNNLPTKESYYYYDKSGNVTEKESNVATFPMFRQISDKTEMSNLPLLFTFNMSSPGQEIVLDAYYDTALSRVYIDYNKKMLFNQEHEIYAGEREVINNITYDMGVLLRRLGNGFKCRIMTIEGNAPVDFKSWSWVTGYQSYNVDIDKYTVYYEGVNEILLNENADVKLKSAMLEWLGYYNASASLPHMTLEAGGQSYDVFDTAKFPYTLIAEENMKHPAITLDLKDDKYSVFYGTIDITDVVEDAATISSDCGSYWKSVFEDINKCSQNRESYLNASSQQGTQAAVAEYRTAYDYYAARIANYWLNGDANGVLDELKKYPSSVNVQQTTKTNLTDEEKLRLQVFVSILNKCGDANYSNNMDTLINNVIDLQWNTGSPVNVSVTNTNGIRLTMDMLDNDWTSLYEDKYSEYNAAANQTIDGELENAYAVAVYYAAKMYGAETSLNSSEIGNLGTIPKSEYIESIALNITSTGLGMLNLNFSGGPGSQYYGIPAMRNIASIAGTEEAYDAYYNLNLLIAVIASYCNDHEADFKTGQNGWVDELIAADASDIVNLAEYATLKDNLSKVQVCININETLNYLGIDTNWLPSIATVCSAGNALTAYKDMALKMQSEYVANETEPMKTFFNLSNGTYATDYLTGVALSATFKPMQTNMYDVQSVSFVEDTDWVTRFHYPWGFYRKALYIDTDPSAAVNKYITSKSSKGHTRVATLGDLLEAEKDIVLYIDDRFYNTKSLADKMGMAYNKVQNTDETITNGESIGLLERLKETFDVDVESIVKTGGNTAYSRSVYKRVAQIGEEKKSTDFVDGSLMDLETINYQLRGYSDDPDIDYAKQYSVLQSYSVVSSIYRDPALFAKVSRVTGKNPPVFVSSPNLFAMDGVSQAEFNTIYNYAILRNLEDVLPLDYKSQIDLNEPLYIDIYGNILTDSGMVVIPAIANASLCGNEFSPLTVGFMYLYNKGGWKIPGNANNCEIMLSDCFSLDSVTGDYMLTSQRFDDVRINLSKAQLSDEGVIKLMYELAQDNCALGGYLPFDNHVYWMTEILRGAPLEFIDKEVEMITTTISYSKMGVSIANKLDEVIDSFYSAEHKTKILSLPNLAFANGFEYVILYLFKIVFAVLFILMVYRLYLDAINGSLGVKSVISFVMSVVMFLVTCFAVPTLLDVSYYQVNKRLLKNEVLQTVMLSSEKKAEGREIGITGVQAVEDDSRLFLKVDDLSIPWYAVLDDVLVSETGKTLDAIYEDEFQNSSMAFLPRFERQGQNLYIDVDEVMGNSTLMYDKENRVIQNVVRSTPYESFITPYYAILDTLVARINAYNIANDLNNFDTKVMSGGQVRTVGLITPYLISEDFMNTSRDPAGIRDIYDIQTTLVEASVFDDDDRYTMSQSYWYADIDKYSFKALDEMFTEIDDEARHFVSEYKVLLNKISDESFLEVMALSIACKHNSVFRIGNADALEIFDVDTTAVIRLSIAPIQQVMSQCSKSFSRFIYDNGGTLGVIIMAFLLMLYVVGSVLKTVCLMIMIACLFMAVVIRRLVRKDSDGAIEGYLITMAIICVCNAAFSCLFKVSMYLPEMGLSIAASGLMQIVLQCLYIAVLVFLTVVVVNDWRNAGYNVYLAFAARAVAKTSGAIMHAGSQVTDRITDSFKQKSGGEFADRKPESKNGKGNADWDIAKDAQAMSGTDILQRMYDNDQERRSHARRR